MKTIKAFTDTIRECECCNRTNLKGTYLLVDDFNNEFYYGSECAKKQSGLDTKEFKLKTNLTEMINSIISEAVDNVGFSEYEEETVRLIIKYKLTLPVYNYWYKKL